MKKTKHIKLKTKNWKAAVSFLIFTFLIVNFSYAQQSTPAIKKSEKIETIDGKKFYIHSVEKKQTLYSIAKTYSTTVDVVLSNNPDAIDGLKAGDKLKIPVISSVENVKKEIAKKEIISKPKHDTASKKTETKKYETTSPVQPKIDTAGVIVKYNMKNNEDLNVALFIPLSLNTVDQIDVNKISNGEDKLPDDVKMGIEFYEGVKMAFDSLKKEGFKGHLHIYDSNLDSADFEKLLKNPELKEMDLMIGPFNGKKFEAMGKFAKENNINIVAPSTIGNNILLGNPNASKVIPSYVTQADEFAKYVAEKFAGQNIILFNSANPRDKPYLNTFRKTANSILQKSKADTVKEITLSTFNDFIIHATTTTNKDLKTIKVVSAKPNIVVIPSTNQSFVTEAVNKLFLDKQEKGDSIIVFGMSNFKETESLDFSYLNELHAYVSSYTFVDYNNPLTKKFILNYRNGYKTEPTQYSFSGFDITYYYISALQKYGHYLNKKLPDIKQKGIQFEFNFSQTDSGNGYENKSVGIMKFENFGYTRVK